MEESIEQQFGDYHLMKLVGEGGFGKVHLGKHLHSDTEVAIKILDTQLISREQEDFLLEARIISSLEHPSIVRLLDCGVEGGKPFLTMNYAPNGTLRQRHPKGTRVPLQQVVSYVKPVASALSYAHKRGLIHRDIKPENMLLDSQNEVLLGDFGIALISSSSTSRNTKPAAGTVSYMAPEQILGKPHTASDQYALGIVVYEWLCGTLPFLGSFAEVGQQHLFALPPTFKEKGVEIAPSVEAVVRKALAKEPEERFVDVQDFAVALEESAFHQKTAPASVSLLPRTENDLVIPAQEVNRWREELLTRKGTTEPMTPVVPAVPVTPYLPRRRSVLPRNGIGVFCLLLLAVVVVAGAMRYTSLLAAPAILTPAVWVAPKAVPTVAPTVAPTAAPTAAPKAVPTAAPKAVPTVAPTAVPTVAPTAVPTVAPTAVPTVAPTAVPTVAPTTGQGVGPLYVGPSSFGVSGCPVDANGNWVCPVLLTNDPYSPSTTWYATINGGTGVTISQENQQEGVFVNQADGHLGPGGSVWIHITIPQSNCPGIGSGSLSITGPTNVTTTTWYCSLPG